VSLIHEVLGQSLLDLLVDLLHDAPQVVLVLHLELLVVAAALVGGPFLEDIAEPEKDLGSPSGFLAHEVVDVFHHETEVDLVFLCTPSSYLYPLLIDWNSHLF